MKEVKAFQEKVGYYSNGRRVVVIGEDTKKGQSIIVQGSRYDGYTLNQVYNKPSRIKQSIYDDCYEMYRNDPDSESFGICSHNSYAFTVSWLNRYGIVYLTMNSEYIVLFNECIDAIREFLN